MEITVQTKNGRIHRFRQVAVSWERPTDPWRRMDFNLEIENRRSHLLKSRLWIQPVGLARDQIAVPLWCFRSFDLPALTLSVRLPRARGRLGPGYRPIWSQSASCRASRAKSLKSFWHASCEADCPHNGRARGRALYIHRSRSPFQYGCDGFRDERESVSALSIYFFKTVEGSEFLSLVDACHLHVFRVISHAHCILWVGGHFSTNSLWDCVFQHHGERPARIERAASCPTEYLMYSLRVQGGMCFLGIRGKNKQQKTYLFTQFSLFCIAQYHKLQICLRGLYSLYTETSLTFDLTSDQEQLPRYRKYPFTEKKR